MKLSKQQLKRIIREEKNRILEMRHSEIDLSDVAIKQYVAAQYDDFIDMYIRFSSSPEYFLDAWEDHCHENGIPCTQDHLVALVEEAELNEEVEVGEIFIGTRGAY